MSSSNVAKISSPKTVNADRNGIKPTKDNNPKPEPTHKDEGRVRYRTLMAEGKVAMENETMSEDGGMPAQLQQVASWVAPDGNTKNKAKIHVKQPANKRLKTTHPNSNKDATAKASATCLVVSAAASTATMASPPPMKINATPEAVDTPNVLACVSPATHQVQVQAARIPNFISSSSKTSVNNRNKRRISCDSLEPIHIETSSLVQTANPTFNDLAALNKPIYRSVANETDLDPQIHSSSSSTSMANDSDPVVMGNDVSATNTAAAVMMCNSSFSNNTLANLIGNNSSTGNHNAFSQETTNEFQHEFPKFLETNAAIIENAATMSNSVGRNSIHNSTVDSSSNSCSSNMLENNQEPVTSRNEEVSAQDFMKFIGQLSEAIDQHDDVCHTFSSSEENIDDSFDIHPSLIFGDDHHTSMEKSNVCFDHSVFTSCDETQKDKDVWDDNCLSFIFGKPMKDVKMNSISNAAPMPAAYELNNNSARMA